jgi:predicted TIM-barrel fold metal-dependent hydrolase
MSFLVLFFKEEHPYFSQGKTMRVPNKIDLHAHFIPDFYRAALTEAGHAEPDGMKEIPAWNETSAIQNMNDLGISTALLSISSPGVHFGDHAQARRLSRRVNEEAARLVAAHPGRFGFFATLPLPDIDGALQEAAHALDVLGANGVVLETNHHGVYLGDARLEPLWAMLNECAAAVFIHPTSPSCACCGDLSLGYPRPMLKFMFETTRAVVNMMLSGALERHAALRVIVPHGGAALPVLADRVAVMAPMLDLPTPVPRGHVMTLLRRLYYDLAGAPVPRQLSALLQLAPVDHLLYGSDAPFTPAPAVAHLLAQLEQTELLDDATRAMIFCENAKTFLRVAA